MADTNEQQSLAENNEVVESDIAEQDITQANEADALEDSETDEEKNARAIEEEATKRAAKEEKRQLGVQRRIDELTAARYQEKARADHLQTEIERLRQPVQPQQQASGEPQRDQFESYEDYLEAKVTFKAQQIVDKQLEQSATKQKETTTAAEAYKTQQAEQRQFLENRGKLEKEIPDYKDTIEDWEPNLPDTVAAMLIKLPDGPLITYHMAKNPSLEAQFRDQPEYMHGVILGQLIASLKSPPKVTTAPAPGKTVSTTKTTSTGDEPPSDPEQYFAWATRQQKAGKLR
jgi:hypothetical protein